MGSKSKQLAAGLHRRQQPRCCAPRCQPLGIMGKYLFSGEGGGSAKEPCTGSIRPPKGLNADRSSDPNSRSRQLERTIWVCVHR